MLRPAIVKTDAVQGRGEQTMEIITPSAVLRDWRPEDAAALARHADSPGIAARIRDAFPSPYTLADARRFIAAATGSDAGLFLAIEVGGDGIRINNVSPGVTRTPMIAGFPSELVDAVAAHTVLKRIAEPDEVGNVAVWLCTDEARYVTGQSILVDGGYNIAGTR